jgi:hypothetical protein
VGFGSILASVTNCTGKCRLVRGIFVGDVTADPDLWGFCGDAVAREAVAWKATGRCGHAWMTISRCHARNALAHCDWAVSSPRTSLLASNQWLSRRAGRHHEPVADAGDTVTLWRPAGPEELAPSRGFGLARVAAAAARQPIFYPVLNEDYAARIARDWNVPHSGAGYVTRFQVLRSFLDQYEVRQVGGKTILEYWIPAGDLPALNASIVGMIEVTAEYR